MRRTLALLALTLLLAGCGGGEVTAPPPDGETTTSAIETTTTIAETTTSVPASALETSDGFPVTVELADGSLTLDEPPERIVSLSPTATEILFEMGAGDQVVAADEFSTYPEEAPDTDLSGFTPNLEAIASYEPDLVIVANDIDGVVASLEEVGIPAALLPAPADLEGAFAQFDALGALTGHPEEASALVEEMRSEIDEIVGSAPAPGETLTYYHELDPTYFSVTSSTFLGRIYSLFGLENIADPADTDGFGYPQLSEEHILGADPDLIFLADAQCCGVTAESVAARPGWQQITAVEEGNVFVVDEDVASRWGPRIVAYVRTVAEAVAEAGQAG